MDPPGNNEGSEQNPEPDTDIGTGTSDTGTESNLDTDIDKGTHTSYNDTKPNPDIQVSESITTDRGGVELPGKAAVTVPAGA